MSEPCKNCGRPNCPTLTMPELTSDAAWMVRYRARNDCVDHTVNWRDRALAAEKQAEIDADRANIYRDKMQAAKDECRALEGRALKAEKQLATLAESGTGYSQQTVDAIVMERDALRVRVTELENSRYDGGDEHM